MGTLEILGERCGLLTLLLDVLPATYILLVIGELALTSITSSGAEALTVAMLSVLLPKIGVGMSVVSEALSSTTVEASSSINGIFKSVSDGEGVEGKILNTGHLTLLANDLTVTGR